MSIDGAIRDLASMISKDEKVLWFSKPDKLCFVLESIFNPLLPIAIVFLAFDLTIVSAIYNTEEKLPVVFALFMLFIHLMPVWVYIGGVLMTFLKYKNTGYIVTTKGIYASGGFLTRTYNMKPFNEVSYVNIHRGIIDQLIGVGDVIATCNSGDAYTINGRQIGGGISICDIADYQRVFKMVKELQEDVFSDTMYPNALRPENNPGYNTRYNAKRDWNQW